VTAELAQKTDRCGSCGKPCGEIRYRLKSGLVRCRREAARNRATTRAMVQQLFDGHHVAVQRRERDASADRLSRKDANP
jgi:hypothetical protein